MSQNAAFDLVRDQMITEITSRARLYRHKKTGAEVLSLSNDDENKVFGITFKTPPEDSSGVAHILEHSVLCGSRKYPVKKPFVELLKSSLQTFLNAMTFPDKTAYPVASQNLKDFYNLVDVYLDAVFFPLISEDTFRQEGWHYETEGAQAPLIYKGVVFNEMKGAFSSPAAVLGKLSQQSLYPDITYGVSSGGDPDAIPNLTYQYFKNFHARYYHPSNSRIMFYGDDDADKRLDILDAYLSQFERIAGDPEIALQPRFSAPRQLTKTYAASAAEAGKKTGMVTVNWMLDEIKDPELALGLNILEHVLVGNSAAPLKKALTDSGLGEGLTGSGLVDDFRQPMFTVGLKGIDEVDGGKVEALIVSTLEKLAKDGVAAETIEASVNSFEFAMRENNTGSFPRGIALMFRAMGPWLHGGDPFEPLAFEAALKSLKAKLAAGQKVFEGYIRSQLLNNQHRTTVLLKADPGQEAREAAEERARLDAARANMDEMAIAEVMATEQKLKALQDEVDAPEALAKIPTLTRADLPASNKPIPIERSTLAGAWLFIHELATNGVFYLDVGFDLHVLEPEMLPYLSIFSRALLQTGTTTQDFVSLTQRIGRSTGGIGPSRVLSTMRGGKGTAAWLFLRGKSVPEKSPELFAILSDVILRARLDNVGRIRQMVLEEKAGFESRIAGMGNALVNMRLRASLNEADWANEQMSGVSYLFFLRDLLTKIDSDWGQVQGMLERMRDRLINRGAMVVNVTSDAAIWTKVKPELEAFLNELPVAPAAPAAWSVGLPRSEGLTFPGQVNYVAKGADLFRLGYHPSGASAVALRYLNTTYLWDKVRVQGGAYGGSAGFDSFSGAFAFTSYRDPNLLDTLKAYDEAAAFLTAGIGEQDLTRSIIGVIGAVDTYRLPDAKGFTSLMYELMGDDETARQQRRDQVLNASAKDFSSFAEALAAVARDGQVVVLGSEAAIKTANEENGDFLAVTKVL